MTELNVVKLGDKLWEFLNAALKGKAHEFFISCDELNGFDGWRRIVQLIYTSAKINRATLRRQVKLMPQITKIEDIDAGILHFESVMREYGKAGGVLPTDAEMKEDLKDTLPKEIVKELRSLSGSEMGKAGSRVSFVEFVAHVREAAAEELFNERKAGAGVHVAAESLECVPCGGTEADFEACNEEVNAVMRQRFQTNASRGKPG